jgi:hypothetical protein
MAKKKVHKLKDTSPEAFRVICISSHQNDYRLSWAINEKLKIDLTRSEDHQVVSPKSNIKQTFSHYSYSQDQYEVSYHLISNKSENGYLLKKYNNIDYLLKISGELSNISMPELVTLLKEIPIVNTAFELDDLTPANKKRLSI